MDTKALNTSAQLQYYTTLISLIASVVLAAATFSWLDTDAVAWVPIICALKLLYLSRLPLMLFVPYVN